jgi:hypothetical protein
MAKLIFKTNFGAFLAGEEHELTGITADYFLNNNIAEEVVEKKEGCGCGEAKAEAEVTEDAPKAKSTKKK